MTPTLCPLQSQRPGWGWLSLCSARLGPCGGCARCPPRRTSARTDSRGKCLRLQFTSFRSPVPRRRGCNLSHCGVALPSPARHVLGSPWVSI
jgi:hypothetical protein